MKIKTNIFKMNREIIYIEWCDAMSHGAAWMSEEEAIEWAETNHWVNRQVGFVVKETTEYLLLAGEESIYDIDNPKLGQVIKIPTTWILKRETLKTKNK